MLAPAVFAIGSRERGIRERYTTNITITLLQQGSQKRLRENIKKEAKYPLLEQLYLIITNLQNINYNTIYTLSLYNGLFVYCMIKRSKRSLDASLQLSQSRHLRHMYFSHVLALTIAPLHLRTVILSQNPDVSHGLLLRT